MLPKKYKTGNRAFGSCRNFGLNCVRTISLAEIQTQKNTRRFFRPKKIQELKILDPKKYVGPPVTFIPEYPLWGSQRVGIFPPKASVETREDQGVPLDPLLVEIKGTVSLLAA